MWSTWTACSQTCGTGTKSRSRSCDNPVPNYNGQNCTGEYAQAISCKITSCPGKRNGTQLASQMALNHLLFSRLNLQPTKGTDVTKLCNLDELRTLS